MSVDASWSRRTPEGRWSGFGPYYAMFPIAFARHAVEQFSRPGDLVLDPFAGRGTSLFVAKAMGRDALGCDINPVGWIYGAVKLNPEPNPERVVARLNEVAKKVRPIDRSAANEFQKYAWSPNVLGLLNVARRELDWEHDRTDRTLMAFILVYLHAKLGGGLSNQLRQSKSMSPDYAVRWWKQKKMLPPDINPVAFLEQRVHWRYKYGVLTSKSNSKCLLGDARTTLKSLTKRKADLIITSPPYKGVTNYVYDNWIRLWMLGGPALPNWSSVGRLDNAITYDRLISEVFVQCKRHTKPTAIILARVDRREFTLRTCIRAMHSTWSEHHAYARFSAAPERTQTMLFGDFERKPGEVDILFAPPDFKAPDSFVELNVRNAEISLARILPRSAAA